jgi:methyl-accepting chemotaxis protein
VKHVRKQYIVDRHFQIGFIKRFTWLVVASSLLLGIIIFLLTQGSTTVAIEKTKVYAKPTSDFILPTLSLTVLAVTTIAGISVGLIAFFISHRIAGPAFRLKREIELLKKGSLSRDFSIRKHDHLKDLASSLQDMTDTFYERHTALKRDYEKLTQLLRREGIMIDWEDREEIEKALNNIEQNIDYFKV